jgi:hypothetical protein
MTFIDEILAEAEVREKQERIQMDKLRADQLLQAIAKLEAQADEVNKLANDEIEIVECYRESELQKFDKKASWLVYQLEQYIRSTDEKTIHLPHGTIRLRMGRDKLEIKDLERLIPFAERKGLLKQVPESYEPDMQKIQAHIKHGGIVPPGITLIPATTKFSYTTKGKDNGNGQTESEAGTEAE